MPSPNKLRSFQTLEFRKSVLKRSFSNSILGVYLLYGTINHFLFQPLGYCCTVSWPQNKMVSSDCFGNTASCEQRVFNMPIVLKAGCPHAHSHAHLHVMLVPCMTRDASSQDCYSTHNYAQNLGSERGYCWPIDAASFGVQVMRISGGEHE